MCYRRDDYTLAQLLLCPRDDHKEGANSRAKWLTHSVCPLAVWEKSAKRVMTAAAAAAVNVIVWC